MNKPLEARLGQVLADYLPSQPEHRVWEAMLSAMKKAYNMGKQDQRRIIAAAYRAEKT